MSVVVATAEEVAGYHVHPIASMFPLIEGVAFEELVADIRLHGLREPVVLDRDGVLLDGRNRVRACEAAGVAITETPYAGDDVAGFIVSHNLHRRHLTDSQRALIAARMANLPHGGAIYSSKNETPIGDSTPAVTRADAKHLMQVSEGSLHRAKVITAHAIPDVISLAERGEVSLNAGAEIARLPVQEQEQFVADVKAGRPAKRAALKSEVLAERIGALADKGFASAQIAKRLGFGEEHVRRTARDFGIEIPADKATYRTRRIDSIRVAREAVMAADGLASTVDLVTDLSGLDPREALQWTASLDLSIKALRALNSKIKEAVL